MSIEPPAPAPAAAIERAVPFPFTAAWDLAVSRATPWRPPRCKTVVVAPHPDDEVLGAGGLIAFQRQRGRPVQVVAVTDGDAAYPDQPGHQLAAVRRREQAQALAALGVSNDQVVRCGIPDGRVGRHVDVLVATLSSLVRPRDLVVAPWIHDHHTDHVACGQAAAEVAGTLGASLIGSLFWAFHHTDPEVDADAEFIRFDLDDALVDRRALALAAHQSQLPGGADKSVLDPGLLSPLDRRVELFVRAR